MEERECPLRQSFWKELMKEVFGHEQGVMNEVGALLREAESLTVSGTGS